MLTAKKLLYKGIKWERAKKLGGECLRAIDYSFFSPMSFVNIGISKPPTELPRVITRR